MDDTSAAILAAVTKHWPYRQVQVTGPVYECGVCRCVVVDRQQHADACLTSQDDKWLATFATELGRGLRAASATEPSRVPDQQ